MATITEQRLILTDLERRAFSDLVRLWQGATASDDFVGWMRIAYPELVAQYATIAADLAAVWYAELAPALPYKPIPKALTADNLLAWGKSLDWALNTGTGTDALPLLQGSMQRGIWDGARDTTIENATREAVRWRRRASPGACSFCLMLASRGAVYQGAGIIETPEGTIQTVVGRGRDVLTNFDANGNRKKGGQAKGVKQRGKQKIGDKYHDHCHCTVVAERVVIEPTSQLEYADPSYQPLR